MGDIEAREARELAQPLADLTKEARGFYDDAHAPETRRVYDSDFRVFSAWCAEFGFAAMPATSEAVILFVTSQQAKGRALATIKRRLTSIAVKHNEAGQPDPTRNDLVRKVMQGITRKLGTRQAKKEPLRSEDITQLLAGIPDTPIGARDKAIIAIGFAGAFRRSEIAALRFEDLKRLPDGLRILLPRSKTDQKGEGRPVFIQYGQNPETCPIRLLDAYTARMNLTSGPLFRRIFVNDRIADYALQGHAIWRMVKARVAAILGRDAAEFGAHSLRSGCATTLSEAGVPLQDIARHGRWDDMSMAAEYIHDEAGRKQVSAKLGL